MPNIDAKGFLTEFKAFLTKTNALALAVAFVIGGAFGDVVGAVVKGLVMPLVSLVLPSDLGWMGLHVGPFMIGIVLGAVVNFVVVAFVIFLIVKAILTPKPGPAPAPTTKECPQCCEQVPLAAKKCRACASSI